MRYEMIPSTGTDLLREILLSEERMKDSVVSGMAGVLLLLSGVSWEMRDATATSRNLSMGSLSLMKQLEQTWI